MNPALFQTFQLDSANLLYLAHPQGDLLLDSTQFDTIWNLHPAEFHRVKIMGKEVPTPRWQQAYGKNYRYTGSKNNALPIPAELQPFMDWAKENVDARLNGLLLNWYDGQHRHYIGAHRDDLRDMVPGSPIVTISLGQERMFRMRPYKKAGFQDFAMPNGSAIVIPFETNLHWTHEVPHKAEYDGRRISVTLRAYE